MDKAVSLHLGESKSKTSGFIKKIFVSPKVPLKLEISGSLDVIKIFQFMDNFKEHIYQSIFH